MTVKLCSIAIAGLLTASCFINDANASVISLEGDYISTQVADDGTLGNGTLGNLFKYDSTGTGSFASGDSYDWISPGSPWEGFSVFSNESGELINNNDFGSDINGLTTDTSGASVYDSSATFVATYGSLFSITTETFFNDDSSYVSFNTSITALTDLTDVLFSRQFDPDWFTPTGCGDFTTTNVKASDNLVTATGCDGATIGIYSDSDVQHDVGYGSWSSTPSYWLGGPETGAFDDNAIGIGFDLGDLVTGDSISFDYSYVMGPTADDLDIPTNVPEPSMLAIFAMGLFGLTFRKLKKK